MARVIVLPDADHLVDGIEGIQGDLLLAEQVEPVHLDDLESSQKFLDRLEWAICGGFREATT